MIAQARERPNTGFIGVEPFVNGMAKALAAIESGNLRNIRLHFDDAANLIAWLPEASLARIDLIHPDPWPKRRHWKRRFVQDEMMARLARILRPGGEFRFVTDIADYAAWTLAACFLRSSDFEWTARCADDWRKPWPGFTPTRYHAKAARAATGLVLPDFSQNVIRLILPHLPEAHDALRGRRRQALIIGEGLVESLTGSTLSVRADQKNDFTVGQATPAALHRMSTGSGRSPPMSRSTTLIGTLASAARRHHRLLIFAVAAKALTKPPRSSGRRGSG